MAAFMLPQSDLRFGSVIALCALVGPVLVVRLKVRLVLPDVGASGAAGGAHEHVEAGVAHHVIFERMRRTEAFLAQIACKQRTLSRALVLAASGQNQTAAIRFWTAHPQIRRPRTRLGWCFWAVKRVAVLEVRLQKDIAAETTLARPTGEASHRVHLSLVVQQRMGCAPSEMTALHMAPEARRVQNHSRR